MLPHLKDNPDYYIDGGSKIPEINRDILSILDAKVECLGIKLDEYSHGQFRVDDLEYKYSYIDYYAKVLNSNWDSPVNALIVSMSYISSCSTWNGKFLYLKFALKAKEKWYIIYSAAKNSLSDKAKYMRNSLVSSGFANYDDEQCRFYIDNTKI